MGKPGRQANFELLRIIAMFMVVILHWNTNSGLLLDVGSPVTGAGVWSLVTESVCIVAVNVYVLISGYFLSSCTFSFRRVAQVLVQTLFYTVLIPPVLALVGVLSWSEVLNPYHIWNSIFPVQSGPLLVRERLCGAVPAVSIFQRRAGSPFQKADAAAAGGAFVLFLHRKILQSAAVCVGSFRI